MVLPQLTALRPYLTDGGLETTLVFHNGIDLPDFAAFPLLDDVDGRAALARYYATYFDLAAELGLGFIIGTPTWRANPDWGARLGYDTDAVADVNRRSVDFVRELAAGRGEVDTVLDGVVGPRGDGYVVGATMSPDEAAEYHGVQARAFADAGADMLSVLTMNYADEATGVVRAATAVGLPVVASFTVETDGRLPSGQPLGEAIQEVDDATAAAAAYFMVNCAHPTHFAAEFAGGADWLDRIKGVRANASTLSHEELDAATELDRGDIDELAQLHRALDGTLDLRVVGGCCGTDDEHVAAIARAVVTSG